MVILQAVITVSLLNLFIAIPLRQRIQQLEEENRALRNGQSYTPNYARDYPPNTGASQSYINYGRYTAYSSSKYFIVLYNFPG